MINNVNEVKNVQITYFFLGSEPLNNYSKIIKSKATIFVNTKCLI